MLILLDFRLVIATCLLSYNALITINTLGCQTFDLGNINLCATKFVFFKIVSLNI